MTHLLVLREWVAKVDVKTGGDLVRIHHMLQNDTHTCTVCTYMYQQALQAHVTVM